MAIDHVIDTGSVPPRRHPPDRGGRLLLSRRAAMWALLILATPVFIDARTGRILLVNLFTDRGPDASVLAIHMGALVVPPLAFVVLAKRLAGRRPLPRLAGSFQVGGLMILFTISIAVGVLIGRSSLAVAFYLQTMIPLTAFYLGANANISIKRLAGVVVGAIVASTVIVLASVALAGTVDPRDLVGLVIGGIPQYRNFYPAVLVVGIALAFNFRYLRPRAYTCALVVFALALPFVWSRSGMAMVVIALTVSIYLYLRRPPFSRRPSRALIVVSAGVVASAVVAMLLNFSVIASRIDNSGVVAGGPGDQRRLSLAETAISYIIDSPITGRAFLPEAELIRDPDDVVSTFKAHNQYLDFALKGGILAAALFIALLFSGLRVGATAWRTGPSLEARRLGAAMMSIVAAVSFGAMFHLLFVQPYTASLLFFLLGFASSQGVWHPTDGVNQRGNAVG